MQSCSEAVKWAKPYATLQAAWDACERADWMCWLLVHLHPHTTGQVRLALCACARTALKYVPAGEERPRLAIECAERYAMGQATDAELAAAWDAAWAAAWDAAWVAALKDMSVVVRRMVPDPEHLPKLEDM
jgi:hypothetical protein